MIYSKATILSSVAQHARALLAVAACLAASVGAPGTCFAASVHIDHVVSTVGDGGSGLGANIIGVLIGLLVEALQGR